MQNRTLVRNRARALRMSMSEPEVMLWSRLRGRADGRPTFRRQHPIENVILDFYCPAARLAVEVDGSTHWTDEERAKDAARDRWLQSRGIVTMRIPAGWIFRDLSGVADAVIRRAEELISSAGAPGFPLHRPLCGGRSPSRHRCRGGGGS